MNPPTEWQTSHQRKQNLHLCREIYNFLVKHYGHDENGCVYVIFVAIFLCLQYTDTVGFASGKASGLAFWCWLTWAVWKKRLLNELLWPKIIANALVYGDGRLPSTCCTLVRIQ